MASWNVRRALKSLSSNRLPRVLCLFASLASLCAGAALAWRHPLWPAPVLSAFLAWCVVAAWWPRAWLWLVPALLPLLNFSPWTGWIVFEEFDLLLLGALAGGYGRLALGGRGLFGNEEPRHREAEGRGDPCPNTNSLDCHASLAMTAGRLPVHGRYAVCAVANRPLAMTDLTAWIAASLRSSQ